MTIITLMLHISITRRGPSPPRFHVHRLLHFPITLDHPPRLGDAVCRHKPREHQQQHRQSGCQPACDLVATLNGRRGKNEGTEQRPHEHGAPDSHDLDHLVRRDSLAADTGLVVADSRYVEVDALLHPDPEVGHDALVVSARTARAEKTYLRHGDDEESPGEFFFLGCFVAHAYPEVGVSEATDTEQEEGKSADE